AGIVRWMVDGCLDWQANGLTPAPAITEATSEYFEKQDLFSQWLNEKCDAEPGNLFKSATSAELFKSWSEFLKIAGEAPGTQKGFAGIMKQHNFVLDRTKKVRLWRGLRLKVEDYGF